MSARPPVGEMAVGEWERFEVCSERVVPVSEMVVRQFIPAYNSAPSIIVIAQQWPCWLSTALVLQLPVIGGYFSSRFHEFFQVPDSLNLMSSWSTVDLFRGINDEHRGCTVLASGSINFLSAVERGCVGHTGGQVFAVDHYFPRTNERDTTPSYRMWGAHRMRDGYVSGSLAPADYGGAANAVHFVFHHGIQAAIPSPVGFVPRVLRHFVNSALRGGFTAIDPPPLYQEIQQLGHPSSLKNSGGLRVFMMYTIRLESMPFSVSSSRLVGCGGDSPRRSG